jgi:hypothetical protein
MAKKTSLLPSPAQLQLYRQVDSRLPELVVQVADHEAQREYHYALAGMISSGVLFLSVVGGFVYLVMNDHSKAAAGLLGAGVLGLIHAILRARLRSKS